MAIFDGMTNEQIEKMILELGLRITMTPELVPKSLDSYLSNKYENDSDLGQALMTIYMALSLTPEQIRGAKRVALSES